MNAPGTPALRAWLGWRAQRLTLRPEGWTAFMGDLNRTFVPATWLLMRPYGLLGYLPSLAPETKPAHVPDEVALLIYSSTADYERHKTTVAGRSYSVMHRALFEFDDPTRRSRSGWAAPPPMAGRLQAVHRPARDEGLDFRHPQTVPVCLILSGPTGQVADPAQVLAHLGQDRHEAVAVCEAGLTVAWVATRACEGVRSPRLLGETLATALKWPPSSVVAAHAIPTAELPSDDANTPDHDAHPTPLLVPDSGWCFRRDPHA